MKYPDFIETVKEHIKEVIQKQVHVYPVLKNNGAVYDGLVIIDPILNISPTIYLNPYYHRYLEGVSMEDIFEDILKTYQENLPDSDFDVSLFQDFAKAKERIVMKLINASKNETLLTKVPHILIYDLAIVFLCNVSDFVNEFATILIYNHHLSLWDVDTQDLYEIAQLNTPNLLRPQLDNLHDVYKYITEDTLPYLDDLDVNIMTNHLKIHGATCMVYPKLLDEISDIYEDDIIIIPSSIHEILFFPKENIPNGYSLEELNTIIEDINETQLTDDEILSDHIYWYHRDSKTITY